MSATDTALFALAGGVVGGVIFYSADSAIKKAVDNKVGAVAIGILAGMGAGALLGSKFNIVGKGVEELRLML